MARAWVILVASLFQFYIFYNAVPHMSLAPAILASFIQWSFKTMCAGFLIACVRFGWDK